MGEVIHSQSFPPCARPLNSVIKDESGASAASDPMTTALDNLKSEVEKVVLNWIALFNNSEIPLEAYRDIEFEEKTDQWQMSSGLGPDWSSLYFRFSLPPVVEVSLTAVVQRSRLDRSALR